MKNRRTACEAKSALVLLASALALPATAMAGTKGSVVVQKVETRGTGDAREVVIHTSAEPTFSVFRLSEPFRVLVDVNDARMGDATNLMKIQDGVIRYVATNQFVDEQSSILRVEIALEAPAQYSVRADGARIVVSLGDTSAAPAPAPRPEARATPAPVAEEAPAAPAPAAVHLGKLSRRMRGRQPVLSLPVLSGEADGVKVEMMQLEDPARVVVDLLGATAEPKWQRVNVDKLGITRARVATKDGAVRIVLDAKSSASLPKVEVSAVAGRLELSLAPAPKPEVPAVAAAPAPATVAEPAVEPEFDPAPELAEAPAPAAPAAPAAEERKTLVADAVLDATPKPAPAASVRNVKDVRFEQKDGFVRLTIFLDDAAPVATKESPKGADVPTLRVPRTALPENLERTLDVSDVAGGVLSAVSTYADGGDLVIAANIAPGTEHRHWAKKDRLMWDFRNRTAEMPTTKVAQYPEEVTSSYSAASAALQATSKLAPSKERYKGRRVSLDIKDADVQNVLRLLADVSKLNIVASDDVSGKITIKLRNVPWDQALDIVLRAKQLDKVRNGNIIRVAPVDVLAKEEKLRIDRAAQRIELEPLTVRLIPVSYSLANEIKPQVESLLTTRGKVNVDVRTNVLVVEDIAEVLLKAERLVRTLDTQTPQVLIESRIVEARSNFSRELGIQWGGSAGASAATNNATGLTFPNTIQVTGGSTDQQTNSFGVSSPANYAVNLPAVVGSGTGGALGFTFGSLGGAALINVRLSAAESNGKVKIISAPRVVTLDNREAKIVSGEKIPITVITANGPTTRFIEANLELTVVPHVTQDGSVLLKVTAKKNELSNRIDNLGVPGIITKEADTVMIVRDGDTAVLGGIYRRTASDTKNSVPWLGQIPVLGWLFKKSLTTDARDELLIFISPRIVNRSAALVQTSS